MRANRRAKVVHIAENRDADKRQAADLDATWVEIVDGNPAAGPILQALYEVQRLGFDINDPEVKARILAGGRRDHERRKTETARRTHPPLVYYMQLGNLVKIGFTTNLGSRVAALNPQAVLAVEGGGAPVEHARHREFAEYHVHGEWFRLDGALAERIAALRAEIEQATGEPFDEWLGITA